MEATEASKIELILGDAVRLLVESGASASVVGPFALKFGAKVAQRLAVADQVPKETASSEIDIQATINASVEAAVAKTFAMQPQTTIAKRVRFKVGAKDALTTVSLPALLLTRAIEHWGDKRIANANIRALFDRAPENVSVKSKWLAEELRKVISS